MRARPGPGTLAARVRKKIADKFKGDLRRILELEFVKRKLVHKENKVLPGVLGDPPLKRILNITLVANVFEDNQLIGDLKMAFAGFLKVSTKRFVDPNCELNVWGPEDVANNASVTEQSRAAMPGTTFTNALLPTWSRRGSLAATGPTSGDVRAAGYSQS